MILIYYFSCNNYILGETQKIKEKIVAIKNKIYNEIIEKIKNLKMCDDKLWSIENENEEIERILNLEILYLLKEYFNETFEKIINNDFRKIKDLIENKLNKVKFNFWTEFQKHYFDFVKEKEEILQKKLKSIKI